MLISEGTIETIKDIDIISGSGKTILGYICNPKYLMVIRNGQYRYHEMYIIKTTTDNTKHIFKLLPNEYTIEYLERLVNVGLVESLTITEDVYVKLFKSNNSFYIINDISHLPIESYRFKVYQSIQKIQ